MFRWGLDLVEEENMLVNIERADGGSSNARRQ
jgi:hypothetical protein